MATHMIESTDIIEIDIVPILFFGPPGCGKTSLAQTAALPLTLDFDRGIHGAFNRKEGLRFDSWQDCLDAGGEHGDFKYPKGHSREGESIEYKSLVIDTGGRCLDAMMPAIMASSAKYKGPGGLTPAGWGILGNNFNTWVKTVRSWKKQLVMICHQKNATDPNGNAEVFPDLPGNMAYNEIHKCFDIIGRIRYEGRDRYLDFDPCEGATCCKNRGHLPITKLGRLEDKPNLLANLIEMAKNNIGKTAVSSAALASAIESWNVKLTTVTANLDSLNNILPSLTTEPLGIRRQIWAMILQYADRQDWVFDRGTRKFIHKPEAA